VVVVDSGSSDRTVDVARAAGADVLQFEWDGTFPKKRNWVLRNYSFTTAWVLFLDADERVTPAFIAELKRLLPESPHGGYWLRFDDHFLGKRISRGFPFRKLALFRHDKGEYERIPEEDKWSKLDMEVHEHPIINGSVGEIEASILHYNFHGVHHYLDKHNDYSSWEAERYRYLQGAESEVWNQLTHRQQWKYRNITRWWFPPLYFILNYVFMGGFCDGKVGLHFSFMKMVYFYHVRLKIAESDRYSTANYFERYGCNRRRNHSDQSTADAVEKWTHF